MMGLVSAAFGQLTGSVGDPRAMSAEEIKKMQLAQLRHATQADLNNIMNNWLQNVLRAPPERPLDERFADLKVRLADAIERRRKVNPSFLAD